MYRRLVIGALAALTLTLGALAGSPVSASATGPSFQLEFTSVQPGEMETVHTQDPCPSGSDQSVLGTFTDANNQVFAGINIGYAPNGGSWEGNFLVPDDASIGDGSLAIGCSSDRGSTFTLDYDTSTVHVVASTSSVSMTGELRPYEKVHLASAIPCPAQSDVDLRWYSNDAEFPGQHYDDYTVHLSTDSSGSWSYDLDVIPSNGFRYVGYEGDPWFVRAWCHGNGVDYKYGSLKMVRISDRYVALGDSYSSGLGSYNTNLVDQIPGTMNCANSTDSYPFYIADTIPLPGPPLLNACAGAVTGDVSMWFGNPAQVRDVQSHTQLVTLTVGGNDIDFVGIAQACAHHINNVGYSCATDTSLSANLSNRLAALAGTTEPWSVTGPKNGWPVMSIKSVLQAIRSGSSQAKIYIAGYPHLFGEDTANYVQDGNAPGGYRCVATQGLGPVVSYSLWDVQWMNSIADQLDDVIKGAVDELQDPDIVYVDPMTTFSGHGLCDSGAPYINGVDLDTSNLTNIHPKPESLHPNVTGMHAGYGAVFLAAMGY